MAIKVKLLDQTANYLKEYTYAGTGISFALCTLLKNGKVEALTDFVGCRDAFISYINDHFNKDDKLKGFSTRKTAVLAKVSLGNPRKGGDPYPWFKGTYEEWFKDGMDVGIKIINQFERESKWALSKSYDVEVPEEFNTCIRLVQGSRWWICAPYTFSLFLLLIRSACRYENIYKLGNIENNNLTTDKIIKEFKKIDDNYLYKKTEVPKWLLLIKHRKEIFKGYTTADNYKNSRGYDGVQRLSSGDIINDEVKERFRKICKENKL